MLAYLVIREGTKWTDVFRLIPGRTVTIGRAATNQIVIKDERCSRCHAEVFQNHGNWVLRDLESRNGTMVGGNRVTGDYVLSAGDVVRIANCQLAFVHDISKAFTDPPAGWTQPDFSDETVSALPDLERTASAQPRPPRADQDESADDFEATNITHRRMQTRLLRDAGEGEGSGMVPKWGQAAAKLCRLAFEMASQPDLTSVCRCALEGLLRSVNVDVGAILLAPEGVSEISRGKQLEVIATRSNSDVSYRRVSDFLASTVFRENEAVLARNIVDDSILVGRDSQGLIQATGVICAPIRAGERPLGLVHLYSLASERMPDPDDLEFTLAVADNLALALKNLGRQQELADNVTQQRNEIRQLRHLLGAECELIGSSEALHKVHLDIARAAPSRATVLIRGESGVGKELVARAIHFASPRKKGPFVCLNCAALSETLLESELFGHERGAFTGATERKVGKFEAADKGTLMLDEIGEMSPSIQAKFLRVLEGHPFERVGGSRQIKVDVRVIAATNRNLEEAVNANRFRRDLYFRLRVVEVFVPPLRKRGEDVVELAEHFLNRFRTETGRRIQGFLPETIERMQLYRWPGNIRELKNAIERAVLLTQDEFISVDDLGLTSLAAPSDSHEIIPAKSSFQPTSLADVEREHIRATLENTSWNKSRAASILGIERSTLDRKIRRYSISPRRA
jgi:transcriptional regulator with GAF, ATPase, and Fis domain